MSVIILRTRAEKVLAEVCGGAHTRYAGRWYPLVSGRLPGKKSGPAQGGARLKGLCEIMQKPDQTLGPGRCGPIEWSQCAAADRERPTAGRSDRLAAVAGEAA